MHITSSFARPKPCHLLRESYWENGQVKKRTLANLSALPQPIIDLLRQALRNELPAADPQTAPVRVRASRQHGAVSAILSLVQLLGFDEVLRSKPSPARSRTLAMIICRLLGRDSNLRVERELGPDGRTTLAALLNIRNTARDDLCGALDWLANRQSQIERKLARRHLQEGSLALYTVFSSYIEGSHGPDPDRPQIAYGLLCSPDGCPLAVQCFTGDLANPDALASEVARLRDRFGLERVALVGNHDLFDQTPVKGNLQPVGFDRIAALPRETIRDLADREVIQPGAVGTSGCVGVTAPEFPGERLLVCYNPTELTEAEARLDGLHVIRTSLSRQELGDAALIAAYESLAHVERGFQSLNARVPNARRVSHLTKNQVRAHVFLCMLAYYLEWHLRRRWAPLLFVSGDGVAPEGPVASADGKSSRQGLPMQSLPDLLGSLGALTAVELAYTQVPSYAVPTLSELTPLQQRAFELLEAEPHPAPALSDPPGTEAGS